MADSSKPQADKGVTPQGHSFKDIRISHVQNSQINLGDVYNYNQSDVPIKHSYCFRLPAVSSQVFTGRHDELRGMREYLTTNTPGLLRRVVLWGICGAGKTRLALRYAYKYQDEFSAAFLVHAENTATLRRDFRSIARSLNLIDAYTSSTA
ncbi:hypothetical protein BP6252_13556 [Coleophoma cylindrospora]|uniref:NB-ARC domain-containing protein n=1 Tax=Coleophoma cylindrospora TaxID=1849047 RepID=A0A3D8Q8I1_9HELO|nr:hypothetical protein BP6252_13556 [Coleophoma cylindrospora]